jgi:integrase/recombinase XerD
VESVIRSSRLNVSSAPFQTLVLGPYVLRHAYARWFANGAELRIVQELLEPTDISTTQIYTHVLDKRMKG